MNTNNLEIIENSIKSLLYELYPDYENDPDFKETPKRVAKMYKGFFKKYEKSEIEEHMLKTFPTSNNNLVVVKDIKESGLCPHHLMPIEYKVHIGYIPNGMALGLSKFARIVKMMTSFPMLQENLTTEIAKVIEEYLNPKGVIVQVEGVHGCIKFRGVESNAISITSTQLGVLVENEQLKNYFYTLVKN